MSKAMQEIYKALKEQGKTDSDIIQILMDKIDDLESDTAILREEMDNVMNCLRLASQTYMENSKGANQ